MAHGDYYASGDLDVHQDPNRSESTICLPSPSANKRSSTYYPKAGPKVLEEPNLDPFYLERSLAATPTGDSRDARYTKDNHQYYSLPLPQKSYPTDDTYAKRSTIAQLEHEHSLRFHRYTSSTSSGEEPQPLHSKQESFSSVRTDGTTPDLTPSSSFSSNYSTPVCPEAVLKATEQLYKHAQNAQTEHRSRYCLPVPTPPQYAPPPIPVTTDTPSTTPAPPSSSHSAKSLNMRCEEPAAPSSSRRRKPHPTLPNLSRGASSHSSRRKQSSPGIRPPLDPSMISPPCLYNPVTMEPHATHFDQALFIPANDCPSPVPSPVASSPPISRQWTATSMERPSTSTMDPYCEQSVWESDSDTESIGRKSISRRTNDTLRKVRSRAKLRTAKSHPKLHASVDDQTLEKFPVMPDESLSEPFVESLRSASFDRARPSMSREAIPRGLQTLRLVAPSSTSLLRPRSRSRNDSNARESDLDRTAAAALQAKFRRRQRSDSSSVPSTPSGKEHLTSLCYEQTSVATLEEPIDDEKSQPFYRRVMESIRSLNCHRPFARSSPPSK
ncbi:hypothetical protein N7474_005904 [Penicillium riverlandense]|uniref:uncharacterized protein n=1 Tax=Penicillium riverlandense TaxID=1903569 RepID=UPI002547ABB6|nr:uncharacterized protein N7474_005904 [Penicillium riverlandense]KAJ5820313.1 hypothetical protein N7474_005904 [Penicillium riverlandense]